MVTETHYCPVQTYPSTMVSPAEWCTNEVPEPDQFCPEHEDDDRADEQYDNYRE